MAKGDLPLTKWSNGAYLLLFILALLFGDC